MSSSTKDLGPGAYEIPNRVGEGSKYTMAGLEKRRSHETLVPGPGTYMPPLLRNNNHSFSMGKKLTQGGIADNPYLNKIPGPGSHEPKHNFDSKFRSDGFTRFGTSKRTSMNSSAYAVPSPDKYK